MNSILRAVALFAAGALLAPALAQAAEPEKVVVRNRKYAVDNRLEASANVGMTLVDYLTSHVNLSAGLSFNISEEWAVEVGGGYALSKHTNVAQAVADNKARMTPGEGQHADDFADLWRLAWSTTAVVRWAPLYGKMNVAAELPVHFKIYALAGAGYAGLERDSLIYCYGPVPVNRNLASCTDDQSVFTNVLRPLHESKNKPVGVAGVGMRFFTNSWSSLQLEVRDVFFQDEYRVNLPLKLVQQDLAAEREPTYNTMAGAPGLTHLVFVQLGVTFTF